MQFIVTLVVSAFLIAGATSAEATSPTGDKLYDDCRSKNDFKEGFCLGFIEGVIETSPLICPPNGATLGQSQDIVVRFLKESPNMRNHPADLLVVTALSLANWDCKTTRK